MDEIWVYQDWWDQSSLERVDLGNWKIEDLVVLFPNAIYFFATLEPIE